MSRNNSVSDIGRYGWQCQQCQQFNAWDYVRCPACKNPRQAIAVKQEQAKDAIPATGVRVEAKIEGMACSARSARRGPNKTEQRFVEHMPGLWRYEAITFKLANGCRYTPDWVYASASGLITCVEVKNAGFKHPSYGRSRMAWRQASIDFPGISWLWYEWNPKTKQWKCEDAK